ncbi:hypothetical protein F5Y04DRAFT_257457 [Hypomontagnella monticulosa]|nr:hypothetical protein F5Y04DRAFT_257457 [Hypomontagnella monticulosa]
MSLYIDAADGSLTEEKVNTYVTTQPIDDPSTEEGKGTKGLTALALAARNGHTEVVKLLLGKGAEVDGPSTQNRTPLWVMTARKIMAAQEKGDSRAEIVKILLEHKANVKHSDPGLRGLTPLENELKVNRDLKVIRLLVQNGGMTDAAKSLAHDLNRTDIYESMGINQPNSKLREFVASTISALLLFILAWANIAASVYDMFKISGRRDENMARIMEPEGREPTAEELKASIKKYVDDNQLNKFFEKDSGFFDRIVSKAIDLRNDDGTALSEGDNTDKLTKLALYQPIIYCDDSSSMGPTSTQKENRIEDQRNLVQRIASICTKIVPDDLGVHLRFINTELQSADDLKMDRVQELMRDVNPNGSTQLGTRLQDRILQPLFYDKVHDLKRPLFISIITDGVPKGGEEKPDTLKDKIKACQEHLLKEGLSPRSVVFQVSQIGSDPNSKDFLQKLKAENIENVYITTQQLDSKFRDLQNNERDLEAWLFETLVGPILGVES